MHNAIAFSNNDVITIAWSYGLKPADCMGFAIYRIDDKGRETVLPSHAVFKGFKIAPGQSTAEFPIQKFYWKDPYARLVAEKTGNRKFRYKIVPLKGTPGHLIPMTALPMVISNEVIISAQISEKIAAYFNRGLISTQRISRAFHGKPGKKSLLARVANQKDALRASLSGDMVEALTQFIGRARSSGKIYAALYELGDEELIRLLQNLGKKLNLVLSNSSELDAKTKKKVDGNSNARIRVKKTAKEVIDRILPSNHIGHNKFLVYVNASGMPTAVLFGSTNWTATGLCTQTNNTIVIEDSALAKRYLDYWNQLASDTSGAAKPADLQASKLRVKGHHIPPPQGHDIPHPPRLVRLLGDSIVYDLFIVKWSISAMRV